VVFFLVPGGTGFIGSALVRRLLEGGLRGCALPRGCDAPWIGFESPGSLLEWGPAEGFPACLHGHRMVGEYLLPEEVAEPLKKDLACRTQRPQSASKARPISFAALSSFFRCRP